MQSFDAFPAIFLAPFQIFHAFFQIGGLTALVCLVIGSLPKHIHAWSIDQGNTESGPQQVSFADPTARDMYKYSLWMRYFIYWWGKNPRSLVEYWWKSLLVPFLVAFSAGELFCVALAAFYATSLVVFFVFALGVASR